MQTHLSTPSKGLLVQHPRAPIRFVGPSAFDIQQAKLDRVGVGLEALAVNLANLLDINYHACDAQTRAHFLNAARIGFEAAQKAGAL